MYDVYIGYKAQLKSYKKKYFDPFRRQYKFFYHYDKSDTTKFTYTNFGQLNFFKWAMEYNIIDYIELNYDVIMNAMYISGIKNNIELNNTENNINKIVKKVNEKNNTMIIYLKFD